MTRENRIIFDLDDIRALRWQCDHCGAATSYPIDQTISFPQSCPACDRDGVRGQPNAQTTAFRDFANALKTVVRLQRELGSPSGSLRIELLDDLATRG